MPLMMNMLAEAASKRTALTYGEVKNAIETKIGGKFSSIATEHIGHVAGSLMHEILAHYPTSPPPPINTLVLNASKRLLGSGSDDFVRKYWPQLTYARLSHEKKREAMRKIHEDVWNYPDWPLVAKDVFKISVVTTASAADEQERDGKAARQGIGGPPEGMEHLRLKKYVEAHPDEFGAPKGCTS